MKTTIDLENMTKLIKAFDSFEVISEAVDLICDSNYDGGELQSKYLVLEVIEDYSILDNSEQKDGSESPFDTIIYNRDIPAEDRAKIIMGIR